MGIGKIKNGMLILSSKDIRYIQNNRNGNNGGLKKRGGGIKKVIPKK
jgi:hypothetical protein